VKRKLQFRCDVTGRIQNNNAATRLQLASPPCLGHIFRMFGSLRSETRLASLSPALPVPTSKVDTLASSSSVDLSTASLSAASLRNTEDSLSSLKHRRITSSIGLQQSLDRKQKLQRKATTYRKHHHLQSYSRKMSFVKANYHPFLFTSITMSALAELALTAFLIGKGNENRTWPTNRYHSL